MLTLRISLVLLFCTSVYAASHALTIEEHDVPNRNNILLNTVYVPAPQPLANHPVVFFMYGWNRHARWHKDLYLYLAEHGVSCLSFDIQGWGLSQGDRNHMPDLDTVMNDMEDVYNYYKQRCGENIIFSGHCAGSSLMIHYLQSQRTAIPAKAAILTSPPLAFRDTAVPPLVHRMIELAAQTFPNLALPVTELAERVKSLTSSSHKSAPADALSKKSSSLYDLAQALAILKKTQKNFHRINVPVHFLIGENDFLIDVEKVEKFYRKLPKGIEKSIVIFKNMNHSILLEKKKRKVFRTILNLAKQCK